MGIRWEYNCCMVRRFEDLEIYKAALTIAKEVYELSKAFPKDETFGMRDQIRRAVASIGANIAEGFGRYHFKDKLLFMYNARGSLYEVKHFLYLAVEVGYLNKESILDLNRRLDDLAVRLANFINSIRKK